MTAARLLGLPCQGQHCPALTRVVRSCLSPQAIFVTFALELFFASLFAENYFLSFFFWVDLVGTASLVLDIQW